MISLRSETFWATPRLVSFGLQSKFSDEHFRPFHMEFPLTTTGKECCPRTTHNKYLTVPDNNQKTNLRGAVDDLRLGPSFHVLVFVHDPHSSFHVLFPHKTFVKRQVMAHSILLILLTSLYVSAKHIFLTQHWKYKRSSLHTRVLTGMETSTFFNQRTITVYTYFPRGRVSPEVSKLVNKPGVDLV